MRLCKIILISASVATTTSGCGSSDSETFYPDYTTTPVENTTLSKNPTSTSKVKFEPFNNVDDVRQNLSTVGIGALGRWRDDEMGGFMSTTSYCQFGGGDMPNTLAYYLESDNSNSIKSLKLVLNINNENKKPTLSKFAETVSKTYKAFGLTPTSQIISGAKTGKEVKLDTDTHTERIELEKSRIETCKFIIETK